MEQQRSDEWFAKRVGRITGSRVGAILGNSPYATPQDTIRAMVREYHGADSEFVGGPHIDWGVNMENEALEHFKLETGLDVEEVGFFPFEDVFGASPDGITSDNCVLEIKSPYSKRNGGEFNSLSDQPHYYDQVQMELLCTGLDKAYFYQWSPHGCKLETVDADQQWRDDNLPVLRQKHSFYLSELDNPEHLEPLRKEINTDAVKLLLDEHDQLKEAQELAKERQKEVLEELVALTGEANALLFGRKLTKVSKAGSISYAKAVKDLCPDADLSKYKGKSSSFWKLS